MYASYTATLSVGAVSFASNGKLGFAILAALGTFAQGIITRANANSVLNLIRAKRLQKAKVKELLKILN